VPIPPFSGANRTNPHKYTSLALRRLITTTVVWTSRASEEAIEFACCSEVTQLMVELLRPLKPPGYAPNL
jgi:hypothetical protein